MSLKLRINLGTRTLGKCAFITLAKYIVLRQVQQIYCGCQELNTVIRTIHTVKKSENKYDILLECYWIYMYDISSSSSPTQHVYRMYFWPPFLLKHTTNFAFSVQKRAPTREKFITGGGDKYQVCMKKLPFKESSQFEKKLGSQDKTSLTIGKKN